MSSGSASFTDTAIHGKLEPPRSLHGVEDAEIIWDTITRRFPNAAPLLCEMETVIERAEDLLQQLRTPCTQGNEHREATENVETQLKVHDINEKQVDLESQHYNESIQCEKKHAYQEYNLNSPLRVDEIAEHFKTSLMNKCHNSQEESNTNVKDNDEAIVVSSEERLMKAVGEANSLEGWANITDNALCKYHNDTEDDNDSETGPSIDRNIDNHSLTVNDDDKSDKSDEKVIKSQHISVARCSANHRSPFTILEEYAKQCKVPITYKCKSKPNLYVINGDLCGFRAMSCAASKDLAKNVWAAKILWMIAVRQMDGSKSVDGLLDFSREEILEIIVLEGELKNASQKLYKFCLEKGESIPKYTIGNSTTHQGFTYTAQCVALGHVGVGQGLRIDSAKIAAAENLYQKYICEEQQST
ncbi:hypothetical protein ALC60_06202 [Trachymyrmex zeteki]|uniref:DRBM domain-containing protein n=1 Tax=Mycetomoellerius zeteki TaxID=64791 RepID=A0A151X399_9HYME|nr:hypothetical protein ALC60_06202 [Trachymyrmex zeteki]